MHAIPNARPHARMHTPHYTHVPTRDYNIILKHVARACVRAGDAASLADSSLLGGCPFHGRVERDEIPTRESPPKQSGTRWTE